MRIVFRRLGPVHRLQHALVLLRPGDRQDIRIGLADRFRLGAHAAGDDHLAVLGHGLADGAERLGLGAVEEAAGVDDDEVGAVVLARKLIAFGAQAGDDPFRIHQRLGAPKRYEADNRRAALFHRLNVRLKGRS